MDGKGTWDIVIATAYALTPFVLVNLPLTLASNYLTLRKAPSTISLEFWGPLTVSLVFIGTMTIHDYDTGKNFWTCL